MGDNVLIVIQARLGSTRLLGKVLLPLGPDQKPVLQHVAERAQRSGYPVVVACPEEDCKPIRSGGVTVSTELWSCSWVGNEDVLGRYAGVVEMRGHLKGAASVIVRITADCPVLDHRLIVRAVEAVEAGHDYAGNTVERCYPRGLDVECFTTELLLKAHQEATSPYDREHVTPWMQRHAVNPYALPKTAEDAPGLTERHRWCLDTPEDRTWLEHAFLRFPDPTSEELLTLDPHWEPLTP